MDMILSEVAKNPTEWPNLLVRSDQIGFGRFGHSVGVLVGS